MCYHLGACFSLQLFDKCLSMSWLPNWGVLPGSTIVAGVCILLLGVILSAVLKFGTQQDSLLTIATFKVDIFYVGDLLVSVACIWVLCFYFSFMPLLILFMFSIVSCSPLLWWVAAFVNYRVKKKKKCLH